MGGFLLEIIYVQSFNPYFQICVCQYHSNYSEDFEVYFADKGYFFVKVYSISQHNLVKCQWAIHTLLGPKCLSKTKHANSIQSYCLKYNCAGVNC